ncbi:hypothetical protein DFH11DRAFT_183517 [Phellopilus nigrolimitatus]|nr:hypothetical protein DFH11DRAFT_183517 [Phellopilus nigrolimitatus]
MRSRGFSDVISSNFFSSGSAAPPRSIPDLTLLSLLSLCIMMIIHKLFTRNDTIVLYLIFSVLVFLDVQTVHTPVEQTF